MFCTNCGTQLPDGSKFCSQCGAPTNASQGAAAAPQQPAYQQPTYQQQPVYQQPAYQQPAYPQQTYAPQATGALLREADKVTRYSGGHAIGTVTGSGTLYVYDDRIEFYKKTGDQRGYMLGPVVGAVMSMSSAKKNPVDVYDFRDIANVRPGKYAGLMGALVLELRTGKSVSFALGKGGMALAEELCGIISQYL